LKKFPHGSFKYVGGDINTVKEFLFMKNTINVNMLRHIIKGCSILLCVFFFTLPLVRCSEDSSYIDTVWEFATGSEDSSYTGWEIATGSGDLFKYSGKSYPLVFILIIVPVILTAAAFANKSFETLSKIAFAGLLVKAIALIFGNLILSDDGAFELTGFNWLIVFIYIGLCAVTYYRVIIEYYYTEHEEADQTSVNSDGSRANVGRTGSINLNIVIGGLVTHFLGIVGLIYSIVTISSDMKPSGFMGTHYTYESPLTNHEVMMIVILIISIISIIATIAGGVMLGKSRK
jgi:hypothetical protein